MVKSAADSQRHYKIVVTNKTTILVIRLLMKNSIISGVVPGKAYNEEFHGLVIHHLTSIFQFLFSVYYGHMCKINPYRVFLVFASEASAKIMAVKLEN